MRVLVTGVTGRIGATVALNLVRAGHQVRGSTRPGSLRAHKGEKLDIEFVYADTCDYEAQLKICKGMDAIVHTAARFGSGVSRKEVYDTGLTGTCYLVEAALATCPDLQRFIFMSTDICQPHTGYIPTPIPEYVQGADALMYGWMKWTCESMLRAYHEQHGLPAVSIRVGNVIGPGEIVSRVLWHFQVQYWLKRWEAVKEKDPAARESCEIIAKLGCDDPEQLLLGRTPLGEPWKKHYADVRDIAEGIRLALTAQHAPGEAIMLASDPVRWDLIVPYLSEKLGIPYVEATLPSPGFYYEFSNDKARALLGFVPTGDYKRFVDDYVALSQGQTMEDAIPV